MIYNDDIYNFDKNKFRVKVDKDQWVTIKDYINKQLYMKDLNEQEYIIFIGCISNWRDILLNMLLLSKKPYLEKYFKKNNLDDNICLAVCNFGYTNDVIRV